MQTLWSRAAAQAQSSCRCRGRICLHSTNALARRSTTATSRRKVTAADLFTACYTTILGTAAIIDARRKNDRRRELDRELDHARASLHQLAPGSPQSVLDGDHGALDGETANTSRLVRDMSGRTAHKPARPLLEELRSLCNIAYQPATRPSWASDQFDWDSIGAAVVAEERDPNIVLREPRTVRRLAETTDVVLSLVDELLQCTEMRSGLPSQNQPKVLDSATDAILEEVEHFRQGREFPSYQSPDVDPSYSIRIRARLNESIRVIFDQGVTLREALGRICYNLLTVGVPPTVHTYNTLMVGFSRIQRPDLVEIVVNSYLHRTNWPATDQTIVCLLAHYRRPGGQDGMRNAVQKIWGARVDDLYLATLDRDLHGFHLSWKRKYHLQIGRRTILLRRKDTTFEHLIRGWLHHGEMDFACMSFVACLRNGSFISIYVLQDLFNGCLVTADFTNARKLLAGITRNLNHFRWYLSKVIQYDRIAVVRELLHSLGQIINICWFPFGEIYGETYQTFASAGTKLKTMIMRLSVQLEVEETARQLTLVSDALSSDEPLSARLELAISGIDPTKFIRRTTTINEDTYIRIARIISVDRRSRDLEERTQNLVAAYNATIISNKTGIDIDAKSLLLSRLHDPALQNKRLALRRALSQLNVHCRPLTIAEVVPQLFWGIPNEELTRQLSKNNNWKRMSIPVLVSLYGYNAASRREAEYEKELSNSNEHLEDRIRVAEDYTRALIFTHVSQKIQHQMMIEYGSYYNIPLLSLLSHLHSEMDRLIGVPQTDGSTVTHNALKPLLQSGLGELVIQNRPIPLKVDSSILERKHGPLKIWGKIRTPQAYEGLSMLRKGDPHVQNAALI